jgi:pimeloyl-ACP methyl ester carboxylesterase
LWRVFHKTTLWKTTMKVDVRRYAEESTVKTGLVTVGRLVLAWVCLACGQAVPEQNTPDRFFDSNGTRIRFQVWGQGPPVVLIHGFGESLESWHQGEVIRSLSPHFQVIAMDVRGHGRSSKPHDHNSYGAELAADVLRLLRHLSLTKAHIVGYSMGALVALDFAVLHKEHALSIVLGGAGWNPPETLDDFKRLAEAYEQGRAPVRDGDDAKALAALLRGLRGLSEEDVRRLQVPMAALIGANDRFMANVQRLSSVLPGVQVMVIPEADHATAPSHPKFGEALLSFLLKQKSAS